MLGAELRAVRIKAGLTQEELAEKVGLTREYVSLIELDKRLPTIPVLMRFSRSLGMRSADLVAILDRIDWSSPKNAGRLPAGKPKSRR